MVYTTSPSHVSAPRPPYRGCAGDILTTYLRLLASGLGVFLIRLRTFLVILAEARFASSPVTHRAHMAGCSLFPAFRLSSSCSLRTPHVTTRPYDARRDAPLSRRQTRHNERSSETEGAALSLLFYYFSNLEPATLGISTSAKALSCSPPL